MDTNLFRKTSIDRVNSPEQLNDYIRVANPSVWILLAAIVFLLVGVVVWGVFGTIETKVDATAIVRDGKATAFVSANSLSSLEVGMAVGIEGEEGVIAGIDKVPVEITDDFPSYFLYLSGLNAGDFAYRVYVDIAGVGDGVYPASIVVDSINPIYFVIH